MIHSPDKLYTTRFWLLCLSNVLFSMSFSMILPELPAYLSSLGGAEYKGLIIGLFTLSAGISRPISGKLTDLLGRVPVMVIGSVVCIVCSLGYPLFSSVFGFLFLRLVHGFSTGFKPTAGTAYIADIVPENRRGEGVGIASISGNIGLSAGPILGSSVAYYYSIDVMFYVSSLMGVLATVVILGMPETLPQKHAFRLDMLKLNASEIINKSAIPPAVVTFLIYMPYGIILTIVPDRCDWLGIENKGMAFAAFTASSIASRLVAGKVSDRMGRIPILYVSAIMIAAGLVLTGYAESESMLYWGMALAGFSLGVGGPSVFAWNIDRSAEAERGKAMGTLYIALEAGIGIGALFSAWVYANNAENFSTAFNITALITLLTVPYLVIFGRKRR